MAAATRASKSASLTSDVAFAIGSGAEYLSSGAASIRAETASLAVLESVCGGHAVGDSISLAWLVPVACESVDISPGSTWSATVLRVVSSAVSCNAGSRGISNSPTGGTAVCTTSYAGGSGSVNTGINCGCRGSGALAFSADVLASAMDALASSGIPGSGTGSGV